METIASFGGSYQLKNDASDLRGADAYVEEHTRPLYSMVLET